MVALVAVTVLTAGGVVYAHDGQHGEGHARRRSASRGRARHGAAHRRRAATRRRVRHASSHRRTRARQNARHTEH
jgi:hypothetical protein